MLNEEEHKELCFLCFQALESGLNPRLYPVTAPPAKFSDLTYPLFVTWYIYPKGSNKSGKGKLKGCVGTFCPNSTLGTTVKKYAAISAFQDDRFMSITMEDLPNLRCDVTLLHDFRPMRDINDFEIGKDGVSLTVTLPSGREVSSCFLPSVICEAGWNHAETQENLLIKSGLGSSYCEKYDVSKMKFEKYCGTVGSATYGEYLEYKGTE